MRNRYRGLFKAAPTPSEVPNTFSVTDGQEWLHACANALGQHRVRRWQGEGSEVQMTTEGGSRFTVVPAGSQDEFLEQVDALKVAFERYEGRPPSDEDADFWDAVRTLRSVYTGPTLDADAVAGALS